MHFELFVEGRPVVLNGPVAQKSSSAISILVLPCAISSRMRFSRWVSFIFSTRFRMQVFNRWGQVVFETNKLDGRGWDGRFNGEMQAMGVYLYRVEADFANGRQERFAGNVTLLR